MVVLPPQELASLLDSFFLSVRVIEPPSLTEPSSSGGSGETRGAVASGDEVDDAQSTPEDENRVVVYTPTPGLATYPVSVKQTNDIVTNDLKKMLDMVGKNTSSSSHWYDCMNLCKLAQDLYVTHTNMTLKKELVTAVIFRDAVDNVGDSAVKEEISQRRALSLLINDETNDFNKRMKDNMVSICYIIICIMVTAILVSLGRTTLDTVETVRIATKFLHDKTQGLVDFSDGIQALLGRGARAVGFISSGPVNGDPNKFNMLPRLNELYKHLLVICKEEIEMSSQKPVLLLHDVPEKPTLRWYGKHCYVSSSSSISLDTKKFLDKLDAWNQIGLGKGGVRRSNVTKTVAFDYAVEKTKVGRDQCIDGEDILKQMVKLPNTALSYTDTPNIGVIGKCSLLQFNVAKKETNLVKGEDLGVFFGEFLEMLCKKWDEMTGVDSKNGRTVKGFWHSGHSGSNFKWFCVGGAFIPVLLHNPNSTNKMMATVTTTKIENLSLDHTIRTHMTTVRDKIKNHPIDIINVDVDKLD